MAGYTREQRLRAVRVYERYDRSAASVINELGYPSHEVLARWVDELECLCSMFLKQFGRYFSAVGAAGFPQCWQCVWTGGLNEEGIGPPDLYIPEL